MEEKDLYNYYSVEYQTIHGTFEADEGTYWKVGLILALLKPIQNVRSLLDVGCVAGTILKLLSKELGAEGSGLDISLPMLKVARDRKESAVSYKEPLPDYP